MQPPRCIVHEHPARYMTKLAQVGASWGKGSVEDPTLVGEANDDGCRRRAMRLDGRRELPNRIKAGDWVTFGKYTTGEPLELNGKRYIVARAGDIAAVSRSGKPVPLKLANVS